MTQTIDSTYNNSYSFNLSSNANFKGTIKSLLELRAGQ